MSNPRPAAYVVKAAIADPAAASFDLPDRKTMYRGKAIVPGDTIFLFASENAGGRGLIAEGVVTAVAAVTRTAGTARQTPRVSIRVDRRAVATKPLGRAELKAFADWADGRPGTELNFKLYRQATDKIVGISAEAAAFLRHRL